MTDNQNGTQQAQGENATSSQPAQAQQTVSSPKPAPPSQSNDIDFGTGIKTTDFSEQPALVKELKTTINTEIKIQKEKE